MIQRSGVYGRGINHERVSITKYSVTSNFLNKKFRIQNCFKIMIHLFKPSKIPLINYLCLKRMCLDLKAEELMFHSI